MFKKRSLTMVLLLTVIVALIAGCSSGTKDGSGTTSSPAAPAETAKASESPSASDATTDKPDLKPGTLRLSTWQLDQEGYGEFWKESIEAFSKEYPQVKIEAYNYASADYSNKLLVELTAGTPPDLITVTGFDFAQLAAMNVFEPLDDLLQNVDLSEYKENLIDFARVDGKLLSFPTMTRTLQLMYNKKLLDEVGISEVPASPEQFYEAVKKLLNADGQYGFAFETNDNRYLYEDILIWVHGFGGQLAKDGKPTLTDPKTIEAVEYLVRMLKENIVPKGIGKSDVRLGFAKGKIAMILDGAWVVPIIEQQNPDMMQDLGIAPTPFASQITTGGTMNLIGVSAQSEHKEAAARFIEMISKPEWQKRWFELTATLTAGKNVIGDAELQSKPYVAEYIKGLDNAIPIPPEGLETKYNQFSGIVQKAVTKAFYSNEPVDQIMQEAQAEAEKLE